MKVVARDPSTEGAAISVVHGELPPDARLVCGPSDVVVFVKDGRPLGALGPGQHALGPEGAPFLATAERARGSLAASAYFVRQTEIAGLRVGGPLGTLQAGAALVSPRILAEAAVRITDPLRVAASVSAAPDADPDATFRSYVAYAVLEGTRATIGARSQTNDLGTVLGSGSAPTLAREVEGVARRRLSDVGVELSRLSAFDLVLSDEDRAALGVPSTSAPSEAVYQMLWDCRFCGTKKLLGQTHRHCPSCGAPQDANARYFPSDAEKVRAEDHEYVGADLTCGHCGEANARLARHCGGCGAPLEGAKEVKRREDPIHGENVPFAGQTSAGGRREHGEPAGTAGATTSKRGFPSLLAGIGCLVALGLVAAVAVALLWKKNDGLLVSGHSWRRSIQIEQYGPVSDSSWCDALPFGARNVRRTREVRSTRKVPDGEDCHVRKVDRGNGTFVEKEECEPRYRSEDIYDERCHYTVDEWRPSRSVDARGTSVSDTLRWPEPTLGRQGTCEGCERVGAKSEAYTVEFTDGKGTKFTCDFDAAKWATFRDGTSWKGAIRVLGNSLDCGSLIADQ
jgi:hypothetical protein